MSPLNKEDREGLLGTDSVEWHLVSLGICLDSSRKWYNEGIINKLPANMITCTLKGCLYFAFITQFILQCVNLNLPPWVIFCGDWRTLAGWGTLRPSWMQESSSQRYAIGENTDYAQSSQCTVIPERGLVASHELPDLSWTIPDSGSWLCRPLWNLPFEDGILWKIRRCSVDSVSSTQSTGKILSE